MPQLTAPDDVTKRIQSTIEESVQQDSSLVGLLRDFLKDTDAADVVHAVFADDQTRLTSIETKYQPVVKVLYALRAMGLATIERMVPLSIGYFAKIALDDADRIRALSLTDQNLSPPVQATNLPEHGQVKLDDEFVNVAELLRLPSFSDAVTAVSKLQQIEIDPANRLPEKTTVGRFGGVAVEIPRHKL